MALIKFLIIFTLCLTSVDTLLAKILIMPLGDSITLGVGPSDPVVELNGYRRDLWNLLKSSGYDVDFIGSLSNGDPDFTDKQHEGHSGWRDDEIAASVYGFLTAKPANIVLLHIGTNALDTSSNDVENILQEIDRWEAENNKTVIAILAEIINREGHVCPVSSTTTTFNNNVREMALRRTNDRVVLLDMECSAGLDYQSDMADLLHPNEMGYAKMADKWFADGLLAVLPMADAGVDQDVNEKTLVTLSGSGSGDPDGTTLDYFWAQHATGTLVALSDPKVEKPTFTAPTVGSSGETLTFDLTVTDADGFKNIDAISVRIQNVLIPPEADAGLDQIVKEGNTVTLNGSNSQDPDGTFSAVKWEQISGKNQVDLTTPAELTTEFTAPDVDADGDMIEFKLTLRDDDDLASEDIVTVTVTPSAVSATSSNGGGCFLQTVMD